MDGGGYCELCYFGRHHREAKKYVCYSWTARDSRLRQWLPIHQLGIQNIHGTEWHPSHQNSPIPNGQAERAVQTFKEAMKRGSNQGTLEARVARFLFQYRTTPHTTTGYTPAELLMGRQLRTHLSLLHPDISQRVHQKKHDQKKSHDKGTKE